MQYKPLAYKARGFFVQRPLDGILAIADEAAQWVLALRRKMLQIAMNPQEFYRNIRRLEAVACDHVRTKYNSEQDETMWYLGAVHVGRSSGITGTGFGYRMRKAVLDTLARKKHRTVSTRGVSTPILRYLLIVAWAKSRYTDPVSGSFVKSRGGPLSRGGQPSRYSIIEEIAANKLIGQRPQFDTTLAWANSPGRLA
jgi:hypothetical protein